MLFRSYVVLTMGGWVHGDVVGFADLERESVMWYMSTGLSASGVVWVMEVERMWCGLWGA